MEHTMDVEYLVFLPMLLILFGLAFSVCMDSYIGKKNRKVMLIIIALIFTLVAQDAADSLLQISSVRRMARIAAVIYGYCARPAVILMFFYIVNPKQKFLQCWVLLGLNTLIHLTAFFSPICFTINNNGTFVRGPLGYSCHFFSGIFLIGLLWVTVQEYRMVKKSDIWIPMINALMIVISVLLDSFLVPAFNSPVSFLTIAVVCCSLFYYIWLHLQFVREHEEALQTEQRIQIMMTQIQPHFLYNTLTTIQSLCRTDPEKAFDVTERFGAYLRQNINSLSQPDLIPLEKELEHTRIYAEIEMVRFPQIRMEYDLQDVAFRVPALTIQPLVENAIRHGVRIRKNGIVSIATRRGDSFHEIVISDNGKGFDVQAAEQADETHLGIRNVRERIEKMCGGTMEIDSRIDEGTRITILIPEQSEREVRS